MEQTATPETGPVGAPASSESIADQIVADLDAGGEAPDDTVEAVTQELVNEAEGTGEAEEAPETEDDATEPAEEVEESPEEAPGEEQLVTVKVNGEERQVPLSEALAGYSRLEDYKAKTAEVAEEKRQLQAKAQTLQADLSAQYADQLEQATNLFAQFDPVLADASKINWEGLKEADPAAYVAAQDAVNERLAAIQRMNKHVADVRAQNQQRLDAELQNERAKRFDVAADEIVKARPELADEAKFTEFANSNVGYLRETGFTQEEIVDALDHRVLTLADKARQWDAHVAAQKSLPEKKVVPKSAVRPLKSDGTGQQASKPRFPRNADRTAKGDWIAQQILSEE